DGDGVLDVGFPCDSGSAYQWCMEHGARGPGNNTLGAMEVWHDPVGFSTGAIAADFDGDGGTDLFQVDSSAQTLTLHLSCTSAAGCPGQGFRVVQPGYRPTSNGTQTPWRVVASGAFLGGRRASLAITDCDSGIGSVKFISLSADGSTLTESAWYPLGYPAN